MSSGGYPSGSRRPAASSSSGSGYSGGPSLAPPGGSSRSRRPGSSGSQGSNGSNSSNSSTSSVDSVLSDDSYLQTLGDLDGRANALLTGEPEIDNLIHRVLEERKKASSRQKKQDPADNARRAWTAQMETDYNAYKAAVRRMETAKSYFERAVNDAKASKVANVPVDQKVNSRLTALKLGKSCLQEAVNAAAARSGFMAKYPDAFGSQSARGHVIAIQQLLSVEATIKGEIETQYNAMKNAVEIDRRNAARAQPPQPAPGGTAPPFGQVPQNPGWFHNPANPGYYQGGSSRR